MKSIAEKIREINKVIDTEPDSPVKTDAYDEISEDDQVVDSVEVVKDSSYLLYSPEMVGYFDEEQQKFVYEISTRGTMNLVGSTSVLDFGCGRGDLKKYLTDAGYQIEYIGVETSFPLVESAKKKYDDIEIIHGSYHELDRWGIEPADWVFNIGNLNLNYGYKNLNGDQYLEFEDVLTQSLKYCNIGTVLALINDNVGNEMYISYKIADICWILDQKFPTHKFNISYSDIENIYIVTVFKSEW